MYESHLFDIEIVRNGYTSALITFQNTIIIYYKSFRYFLHIQDIHKHTNNSI